MGVKPDGSGGDRRPGECPICEGVFGCVPSHIRASHDWE